MHSKLSKKATRFARRKGKEFWNRMADPAKWYLCVDKSNFKWFEKEKIPQNTIDFMNGKKVKMIISPSFFMGKFGSNI